MSEKEKAAEEQGVIFDFLQDLNRRGAISDALCAKAKENVSLRLKVAYKEGFNDGIRYYISKAGEASIDDEEGADAVQG